MHQRLRQSCDKQQILTDSPQVRLLPDLKKQIKDQNE